MNWNGGNFRYCISLNWEPKGRSRGGGMRNVWIKLKLRNKIGNLKSECSETRVRDNEFFRFPPSSHTHSEMRGSATLQRHLRDCTELFCWMEPRFISSFYKRSILINTIWGEREREREREGVCGECIKEREVEG